MLVRHFFSVVVRMHDLPIELKQIVESYLNDPLLGVRQELYVSKMRALHWLNKVFPTPNHGFMIHTKRGFLQGFWVLMKLDINPPRSFYFSSNLHKEHNPSSIFLKINDKILDRYLGFNFRNSSKYIDILSLNLTKYFRKNNLWQKFL